MTNCVVSNNMCGAGAMGGGIDAGYYPNAGLTAVGCRIVNNIASNGTGAGVARRVELRARSLHHPGQPSLSMLLWLKMGLEYI